MRSNVAALFTQTISPNARSPTAFGAKDWLTAGLSGVGDLRAYERGADGTIRRF
jgi:hypothetical protein